MSKSKWMIAMLSLGLLSAQALADAQRTVFTVENQFPRWEQYEAGALVKFTDVDVPFGSVETTEFVPYLRYGFREHIALQVALPIVSVDPEFGSSEEGVGDVELSLQLRAYENIFGYPYVIPHITVSLPTGDDDKGLGEGDPVVTAGISFGDKIYSHVSWVMDLGYRFNPNRDNQFLFSNSAIWHVSPELDFLFEARYQNNSGIDENTHELLFLGGMVYDWTDQLQMGIHAGGAGTGDTNVLAQFRLSYSF